MKNILILFLFSFLVVGCQFEFEEKDLKFYNNYKTGDLLLFRNNLNEIDSFRITEKNIYYTNWTPIERDGKYNPPNAIIKYEKCNTNDFKIFNGNRNVYEDPNFLHFRKHSPDSPTEITFSFENIFKEFNIDMKSVKKEKVLIKDKITDCYIFTEDNIYIKPKEIKKIYLDKDFQILKYELENGNVSTKL